MSRPTGQKGAGDEGGSKARGTRPRVARAHENPARAGAALLVGAGARRQGLRLRPRPLNPDGSFAEPFGKVGAEVSEEEAYEAARLTALAALVSLKRALGDLDRVTAWLRVFGMVNSSPGFDRQPNAINGYSDLILELYGPEVGDHARSAVGMAGLPLGMPVEVEAEVEILGG